MYLKFIFLMTPVKIHLINLTNIFLNFVIWPLKKEFTNLKFIFIITQVKIKLTNLPNVFFNSKYIILQIVIILLITLVFKYLLYTKKSYFNNQLILIFLFINSFLMDGITFVHENIFIIYCVFEIISILTYGLIGLNSLHIKNFKSNLIYFIVGFASSIFFLLGTLIWLLELHKLSAFVILLSLFIKNGLFPFIRWVDLVYTSLNNNVFIIFISAISINFFAFYGLIMNFFPKGTYIGIENLIHFFAIMTLVQGGLFLNRQNCIKGFLGISSILNMSIVLTCYCLPLDYLGFGQNSLAKIINTSGLNYTHYQELFLNTTFSIYNYGPGTDNYRIVDRIILNHLKSKLENTRLALEHHFNPYYQIKPITLENYTLMDHIILDPLEFNLHNICLAMERHFNPYRYKAAAANFDNKEYSYNSTSTIISCYLLVYVISSILVFTYWICLYSNNLSGCNIKYKTYFKTLSQATNKIKDYNLFLFVWVIGGFPPFLLFIYKFYIFFYASLYINIMPLLVLFFLFNSIILYSYLKVIINLFTKLKKSTINVPQSN